MHLFLVLLYIGTYQLKRVKKIEINETFQSVYRDWKQKRISVVEAMKKIGMKSNTFYRRVKEYESNL
ncbi:hypothetical protein [Shimazuella kribbensis]|uniref:hypothetical protein n=1 Tax=Shimazuella kribbensis TaxID=139808 RepID=UPI000416DB7D|nr:hypothetical protein [Shimazuella kribbensis]